MIASKTYCTVFGVLLTLTLLTTGAAFVDLGAQWNNLAALLIATIKALLVASYFMHLRHGPRLTLLFAGAGVIWMAHLLLFSFTDYLTRNW